MGKVVPFPRRRQQSRKLSTKQWQLVIKSCRELYHSPEMQTRRDSHQKTRLKILRMLSRHFGSEDSTLVLDMILTSYLISYLSRLWETRLDTDTSGLLQRISYILALAHMRGSTSGVQRMYAELLREVQEIEETLTNR